MTNTCWEAGEFHLTDSEEGPTDKYGGVWNQWTLWIEHVAEFLRDEDCAIKEALEASDTSQAAELDAAQAAISALQTAVADLQGIDPPEVTREAVLSALSAPLAAITPATTSQPDVVTVLGISVLGGGTSESIENLNDRVNDLEDRLQALGVIA